MNFDWLKKHLWFVGEKNAKWTPKHLFCSLFKAEGESAVLVAGDPERKHMRKVEGEGGIRYHVNLLRAMVSLPKNKTQKAEKLSFRQNIRCSS